MNNALVEKLKQTLAAHHVELVDNSWQHAGHTGNPGGSHLAVTVVSPCFEGVSMLDRHRQVHQVLKAEMSEQIHALELKTWTPQEWDTRK